MIQYVTLATLFLILLIALYIATQVTGGPPGSNSEVIAAIKKARELILQAVYGMRQHKSVAMDEIVDNSKRSLRILVWLEDQWKRFSHK